MIQSTTLLTNIRLHGNLRTGSFGDSECSAEDSEAEHNLIDGLHRSSKREVGFMTCRLPSFVVQQSFDPTTNYYTQFYRHNSADTDGCFSPLLGPGSANKYTGIVAMLSPQSGQPQESGNSLAISTAGPTPLATQAAGVMQNSVAVAQQPVPVFRQPSRVHLENTAFPQQPPTGSV